MFDQPQIEETDWCEMYELLLELEKQSVEEEGESEEAMTLLLLNDFALAA